MTVATPTSRVRDWIYQEIDGMDTVKLPELANAAVAHFSQDPTFVHAFLETHLRPIIYDLAQKAMAATRGRENVIMAGETLLTRDGISKDAKKLQSKWERWLEHVGDRHVRLTEMTKSDLLKAAEERRKRANTDIRIAALWEALAERMEGDQKVGELFTPEQIDKVRISLEEREAAD